MQSDHVASQIYDALGGKRDGKGGWMVHCPAHDDPSPSLHVTPVPGEPLPLVKCFASCAQDVVIAALRAKGVWPERKDFDPPRPAPRKDVRRYDSRDQHGRLLAYKERYQRPGEKAKTFAWYHPDGRLCDEAHPRPEIGLYRQERLRHVQPDVPVYLVEGEKCVEAAEQLGLVAVSPPDGAGSWQDRYANVLRGHIVILTPDNDEPGIRLMQQAGQSLKGKAREIRKLRLPDLGPGDDLFDWVQMGGTRQRIDRLTERADIAGERPRVRLHTIRSMAEVQPRDVDWLWWPYLPLGKLCLLEGDPGKGKSFLTLVIAAALSRGWPLPNQEVPAGPAKVLILADEDGLDDTVRPRLDALEANLKLIRPVVGAFDHNEETPLMLDAEGVQALVAEIEDYAPTLVIIDPLFSYLGGKVDINKGNEVRSVLRPLIDAADLTHTTILGLRHLTKANGNTPLYRGQGNIDFAAAARSVLSVREDPDQPARQVMAHIKYNLSEPGPPLAFSIRNSQPAGLVFTWEGIVNKTNEELFAAPDENRSALEEAMEVIIDILRGGPMASEEAKREVKKAGVSEATMWRAKDRLKIRARKRGNGWFWELPELPTAGTPPPRATRGYRDTDDDPEVDREIIDHTPDEDMEF